MESAPNKRSYTRLAAMRCLLRGMSRREICAVFCRGDRVVRLWILKYNAGGIDALLSKPTGGRRRKVSLQRIGDILVPVLKDPRQAAVEHWTGVKLYGWIKEHLQVELSYATVVRYLYELDFHSRRNCLSRLTRRPCVCVLSVTKRPEVTPSPIKTPNSVALQRWPSARCAGVGNSRRGCSGNCLLRSNS